MATTGGVLAIPVGGDLIREDCDGTKEPLLLMVVVVAAVDFALVIL